MNRISKKDLEDILLNTIDIWEEFRNSQIFLTGGTGFFGIWFVETFIYINEKLGLNSNLTILSRDYESFLLKYPYLSKCGSLKFLKGDIRNFEYIDVSFSHIIHAATTSAEETFNNADSINVFDTVANGTRHLLEFAVRSKVRKILYISSGSVYGKNILEYENGGITEDCLNAPNQLDPKSSALAEAKRVSEFFCIYYGEKYNIEIKIARCFSFIGPHIQLELHYAIGNFIRSKILNTDIIINGNGSPKRTFMYSSDLMIWLWKIFVKGRNFEAYNVGSNEIISIKDLAKLISDKSGNNVSIQVLDKIDKKTSSTSKYVPNIDKAKRELNLNIYTNLNDAIEKTIKFLEGNSNEVY